MNETETKDEGDCCLLNVDSDYVQTFVPNRVFSKFCGRFINMIM